MSEPEYPCPHCSTEMFLFYSNNEVIIMRCPYCAYIEDGQGKQVDYNEEFLRRYIW